MKWTEKADKPHFLYMETKASKFNWKRNIHIKSAFVQNLVYSNCTPATRVSRKYTETFIIKDLMAEKNTSYEMKFNHKRQEEWRVKSTRYHTRHLDRSIWDIQASGDILWKHTMSYFLDQRISVFKIQRKDNRVITKLLPRYVVFMDWLETKLWIWPQYKTNKWSRWSTVTHIVLETKSL